MEDPCPAYCCSFREAAGAGWGIGRGEQSPPLLTDLPCGKKCEWYIHIVTYLPGRPGLEKLP